MKTIAHIIRTQSHLETLTVVTVVEKKKPTNPDQEDSYGH